MGVVLGEDQVIDIYRGKVRTIRTQRCMGCRRALAMEVSDNIGFEAEYWIIDSAVFSYGESEHYFKKSGRWFGNQIQCPTCKRQGKLPMDKPLNWEGMQQQRNKSKEGTNATN